MHTRHFSRRMMRYTTPLVTVIYFPIVMHFQNGYNVTPARKVPEHIVMPQYVGKV